MNYWVNTCSNFKINMSNEVMMRTSKTFQCCEDDELGHVTTEVNQYHFHSSNTGHLLKVWKRTSYISFSRLFI